MLTENEKSKAKNNVKKRCEKIYRQEYQGTRGKKKHDNDMLNEIIIFRVSLTLVLPSCYKLHIWNPLINIY